MHKKYNIQMKYTKSVLWTSCVVILLRDVSIAQQHLWLWQSVAIIIYCFSFCLWTLLSVYWVNIEWTHVELYDLSSINLRLWLWRKCRHRYLLIVPLVALSPVYLVFSSQYYLRVEVNTLSTFSGWVFATVVRIFCWNHSTGKQSLAAAREGWRPRNDPQNMLLCSSEP